MSRVLRMVDLFAGCGGLTRGFLDVNRDADLGVSYRVLAAVEIDQSAAATYSANFGRDHLHAIRIEDWPEDEIPGADVVIGGPPCQGFSNLGQRDPSDPRNSLWREYARTLQRIRPDYFVIENVAAFFNSPQWELLQAESISGLLQNYRLQSGVLNAAEFGVPQVRKRAVVIGYRIDVQEITLPTGPLARQPHRFTTVGDALADIPAYVSPESVELPYERFHFNGVELPGAFKTSQLHITRRLRQISRDRIASVPTGGNRRNISYELLAPCWRTHTSGSMDVMGRLHIDKPSVTVRTEFFKPEKGRYLHPHEIRPLTHAEAALLQTFPLDFQWCGTRTAIARQIGNAVPVKLGYALGRLIASQYA